MELKPILSAMRHRKTGVILIALQVALTLAILANALYVVRDRFEESNRPTGLGYYPLPGRGERFPVNDPEKVSITEPRPENDAEFFQGLLEGIAEVEAAAYARLAELGAQPLRSVRTVGGGARNAAWSLIRAARLNVPMLDAASADAAYGAARLARDGWLGGNG